MVRLGLTVALLSILPWMTSQCEDKNGHCSYWAIKGDCTRPSWQGYMEINCPKSCGFCHRPKSNVLAESTKNKPTKPIITSKVTSNLGQCRDVIPNCAMWKSYGYCKKLSPYMKQKCKLTCGYCETEKRKQELVVHVGDCRDKEMLCGSMYTSDWCSMYKGFMMQRCPKLCGFCSSLKMS